MNTMLRGGKIRREVVLVGERCESIEADPSAHLGIGRSSATNRNDLLFADQCLWRRSHDDDPSDLTRSRKTLSAEILVYPAMLMSADVIKATTLRRKSRANLFGINE